MALVTGEAAIQTGSAIRLRDKVALVTGASKGIVRGIVDRFIAERATVEEVAAIAIFPTSDEASGVTGQTIYVDGGRLPLACTV